MNRESVPRSRLEPNFRQVKTTSGDLSTGHGLGFRAVARRSGILRAQRKRAR